MLYMTTTNGELKIVILESANIEEIKKGRPAKTPDKSVLVAWTPDPVWLADQILMSDGDAETIAKLIDIASKRPQKPFNRPRHETHYHKFEK